MPASLSALNRGRRAAQADMRATCRITKPGVGDVWNPVTLQYEPAPRVTVYEGRCKLRRSGYVAGRKTVAGQLLIENGSTLHLPVVGSTSVGKDHEGVMLSSVTDPGVVGAKFVVEKGEAYDNATSRRFTVNGVQ